MKKCLVLAPLFLTFFMPALAGEKRSPGEELIRHARSLLGTPYRLGGRLAQGAQGIDCQGVVFYAAERVGSCAWRSFDVFPSRSIPNQELGASVKGLAPVATSDLKVRDLRPGDVLHLLGPAKNPAEKSIGKLDGAPVWVWHMGIYSGQGRFIAGDHFAGEVVEEALIPYLKRHADEYVGIWVTRLSGTPHPRRCRHHRNMGAR
jgi:cell wall-associated NlpC family hydrolase